MLKLKNLNKNLKNLVVKIWKDESAQGMTEYVLLVVGLVVVLFTFRDKFKEVMEGAIQKMESQINNFIQ